MEPTPTIEALKKALNRQRSSVPSFSVPEYVVHDDIRICGFWGRYRFLSNFWNCPNGIFYMKTRFPSVEHAYQSAKFSKTEHDKMSSMTVKEVKQVGRKAKLPDDWEDKKYNIMLELVTQKFTNDVDLKQDLLNTGTKYLEETNNWKDTKFGVCDGIGWNMLGKTLMFIRNKIKETNNWIDVLESGSLFIRDELKDLQNNK